MSISHHEANLRRLYKKRLRVLLILAGLLLLSVTLRTAQWTLLHWGHYRELARNNYLHPRRLSPVRGRILARDGSPLAVNRSTYSVFLSPLGVSRKELHRTTLFLEDVLNRDFSEAEEAAWKLRPRWRRNLLARHVSIREAAPILERQWDLPGLRLVADRRRFYLSGPECGHIIGYLGRISPERMEWALEEGYARDDLIGIAGLERYYEDILSGKPGEEVVQRDARGRFIRVLETKPAVPGDDIRLTLDIDFQTHAWLLLEGQEGVIIAANPRNGEILAMVSYPGFDSSNPAAISKPSRPVSFLNKAVQEVYPPASPFKLVTALAGLDEGLTPRQSYECEGRYYLSGWDRPFLCNNIYGHGDQDLENAIKHSCNIYFYKSVQKTGAVSLLEKALQMGYGRPTGIDLPFEVSGNLPLTTADSMWTGSLLHISIGQGKISATPLQVLMSYCAFAEGTRLVTPHLLRYSRNWETGLDRHLPESRRIDLPSSQRNAIIQGLVAVANEKGGTAFSAGFKPEWKVAGKTGTGERSGQKEDDAWFVGFAPYGNPEIAVLVMLEGGGSGGKDAAPVAKEVFKYYFQNRNRLTAE